MESVRPESSRDDLKIFSARVVEKLSRSPKSGQSCHTESASANAGNSGPIWLKEEETGWPDFSNTQIPSTIQSEIESEARSSTFSATAAILVPTTTVEWHLDGISTWNRLVRRTAQISRIIRRSQGKLRPSGPELMESIKVDEKVIRITRLSREELDEVELSIYRQLLLEQYPKAKF